MAARFPSASDLPSKPLDGLKVGVIEQCMGSGLSASVKATADATCRHLESLGATVGAAQLPNFSAGLPAYYVIATSEASSNLSRCKVFKQHPNCLDMVLKRYTRNFLVCGVRNCPL